MRSLSLLSQRLLRILSLSSNDNANAVLEDEIVLALRSVMTYYTDGFDELVDAAKAEILRRDWARPSPHSLEALKNILTKLAFIGCSEIPVDISIDIPSQRPYSALQHFSKPVAALLQLCPLLQARKQILEQNLTSSPAYMALFSTSMMHARPSTRQTF